MVSESRSLVVGRTGEVDYERTDERGPWWTVSVVSGGEVRSGLTLRDRHRTG